MTSNKIRYLASCYQADLRAVSLLNFFSKRAGHQLFLESAELLQGELTQFPVSTAWAREIEKTLAVYSKEKTLFCGSVFLAGSVNIAGKEEDVLAPVYLHPAELIEEDGIFYVAIDVDNPVINPAVLDAEAGSDTGKFEALSAALPRGYFKFDQVHFLKKALHEFFPDWDLLQMASFPALLNEMELKQLSKNIRKEQKFTFLPAAGLCLLDKPAGSRGILNELEAMAGGCVFSNPVLELLAEGWAKPAGKALSEFHIPALLSRSQEAIVGNAGRYPLQLVIGPPGTGKSFTIAALALEMLSRGKSVLIASKNNEAVNVVADKIERDLGISGVVVRASRRDYKKELQKRVENLLSGIGLEHVDARTVRHLDEEVKSHAREVRKLETGIEKLQHQQLIDGDFFRHFEDTFFQKIRKKWVVWRHENQSPLWERMTRLEQLTLFRHKLLRRYLKSVFHFYLGRALNSSRLELQSFVSALKARTGNRKEKYFDAADFNIILRALPIWTVNTADIHRVLPLQREMFDLVIIDEASQCDMASSLPVLQRGKSAFVVGDPKQLRHLSFLSYKQQQALAAMHELPPGDPDRLNYRDHSLLDLTSMNLRSQERVFFLNEHYRSMPDIIAFSNTQFYESRLHVMSATPATLHHRHLFLKKIDGKRFARGHNPAEADYVLHEVTRLMETEAALEATMCQSIGIISPFREQVNHLQRQAEQVFSVEQLQRHRLMVGTPFAFQGEERDVVFLSFVLDDEAHPSAFQYLNREDVFNVSITRARSRQHVCVSFDPQRLGVSSLVRHYLGYVERNPGPASVSGEVFETGEFSEEIKSFLLTLGVEQIFTAYAIAGVELDLVVIHSGKTFGIDLIGYPGAWQDALHLDAWRMLYRTGVPVFYLSYSEWFLDKKRVGEELRRFLGK